MSDTITTFHEAVWISAAKHGMRPAIVSGEIIASLFPRTSAEASGEGAAAYLRDGVTKAVKAVFSRKPIDEKQGDFAQISPAFSMHVENLKRNAYYVESIDEFLTIPELIKRAELLDEARKYLRRKGEEVLAEAAQLDKLYAAVMAVNDNTEQKVAA
jgi:predicted RNA binding protein with dsRBD fold (UPF0201 family)